MASYLAFLVAFIGRVFAVGGRMYSWHEAELYRLRNSALYVVLIPFVLMVVGLLLGPWWTAKSVVMSLMLTVTAFFLLIIGARRAIIGTGIVTALVAARPGTTGAAGTPAIAVDEYVRIVAAILASELTLGLLILVLPLHNFPALSILLMPLVLTVFASWVWKGGEDWWPPFTRRLAIITIGVVVVANLFPQSFMAVEQISNGVDGDLSTAIAVLGNKSTIATWEHIVRIVAIIPVLMVVYCFVRGYTRTGFALLLLFLVLLGGYWFTTSKQTEGLRAEVKKWDTGRRASAKDDREISSVTPAPWNPKVGRRQDASVEVVNPSDPDVIRDKLDRGWFTRLKVVVRPTSSDSDEVVTTPFMRMPECLPRAQFWYDVIPRNDETVLRVKDDKNGQLWVFQAGKYKSGPLPIMMRGDLLVQIETRKEVVLVLSCFT